jgi:hypothetical protein
MMTRTTQIQTPPAYPVRGLAEQAIQRLLSMKAMLNSDPKEILQALILKFLQPGFGCSGHGRHSASPRPITNSKSSLDRKSISSANIVTACR